MSHPILSHVEQECQESLIQESFTFNKIGAKAWSIQKKRNFREFCDSNLSRLHPFDNMAIIH